MYDVHIHSLRIGDEYIVTSTKVTNEFMHNTGLEMFHKTLEQGEAGDYLGALLRGVKRENVRRGMVLCQPGTVIPHSKFKAQVYILKKEEGGRHTPFITRYESQMFTWTANTTASMHLPEGLCMCMSEC